VGPGLVEALSTVFRSAWRAIPAKFSSAAGIDATAARLAWSCGVVNKVVREDGESFDLARQRSFVGATEPRGVGSVDHDRLPTHR
jgi:hypothetical protein